GDSAAASSTTTAAISAIAAGTAMAIAITSVRTSARVSATPSSTSRRSRRVRRPRTASSSGVAGTGSRWTVAMQWTDEASPLPLTRWDVVQTTSASTEIVRGYGVAANAQRRDPLGAYGKHVVLRL